MKSPTAQGAFQPIPDLISCAGVTGRWGLLSHAQNAVMCEVFKYAIINTKLRWYVTIIIDDTYSSKILWSVK